jgi:hypothetical protein
MNACSSKNPECEPLARKRLTGGPLCSEFYPTQPQPSSVVDVNTDRPMQLAAELVRFRSAWRKQHGPGPLDGLKIKALTDKVRIVREALSEPEPEVEF